MKTKKQIKYLFELDSKVTVYVPSTFNVSVETDNNEQVKHVLRELSIMFGGATATNAHGSWVCNDGSLVTESVTLVYAFTTSQILNKNMEKIVALCEHLKEEMQQEAISLEVNNKLGFI